MMLAGGTVWRVRELFAASDVGPAIELVRTLLDVGTLLAVVGAVALVAHAGFQLVTAGENRIRRKRAQTSLRATAIGLSVVLVVRIGFDVALRQGWLTL